MPNLSPFDNVHNGSEPGGQTGAGLRLQAPAVAAPGLGAFLLREALSLVVTAAMYALVAHVALTAGKTIGRYEVQREAWAAPAFAMRCDRMKGDE